MPQTSDYVLDETPQARRELAASQFAGHANAEDLIRSHFASIPPEVRSGLRLAENPEARKAAIDEDAHKDITVPEGGRLIDWTVRGTDPRRQVLSYVWEDGNGKWHHGVQGYGGEYQAPDESPADRAMREVAMADHKERTAGAQFNADLEEKLAEYRRELEAKLSEDFAALKDDLVSAVKKIASGGSDDAAAAATEKAVTPGGSRHNESGDPPPGANTESGGGGEVKWPRTHDDLDTLAKNAKVELPDDWDELKVDPKIEYLESKGVTPEAQG